MCTPRLCAEMSNLLSEYVARSCNVGCIEIQPNQYSYMHGPWIIPYVKPIIVLMALHIILAGA